MKTTRLLLVLLALATGAIAQENSAKLTLAREAIAAMQADKMFDTMATQMKQMAIQMSDGSLPANATPEQRKKIGEFQSKVMDVAMESAKAMITQMDQVYADVYSEAELKAMIAFFKSPEGQSMMTKQPQVMQRVMPLIQSMQRDLAPKMQQLTEELKASMQGSAEAAKQP